MPRYALRIEYDGAAFVGWQRQETAPSVQGALEAAAAALNGAKPTAVYGSGRTDAGVHALGQIAHVDLIGVWRADRLRDAINAHLRPHPISVLEVQEVTEDFHARFSAIRRAYLYRLLDRRPPPALDRGRVWRIPKRLDAEAMHDAAQVLIGRHDFTTFRDAQCQSDSPVKTLDTITVSRAGEEVHVQCDARSFLHRQVRSFVGSLVEVGLGKWTANDLRRALDACDRAQCGPVAPPEGLYLVRVDYPDDGPKPNA
ncbi:MAG: tRNA pseudouridine(38-40) synthase TruA [Maricaulaceae bacterium]